MAICWANAVWAIGQAIPFVRVRQSTDMRHAFRPQGRRPVGPGRSRRTNPLFMLLNTHN